NPITLKTPLPWTGRGQRVKSPVYFNNSAAVPTACPFPTVQSLYVGPSRPSPSWLPLEGTSAIAHTIVANASDKKSLSLRGTSFRASTDNGADGASLYRLPSFASFQIRAMPQSLGQPHQKIHWRRPGRATPPAELRDLLLDSGQSCQAPVLTVFGSAAADWLLI